MRNFQGVLFIFKQWFICGYLTCITVPLGNTSANSRSSHRTCSVRKSVVRNFAKFTGKQLRQRLSFNKVANLRPPASLKKRLWLAQLFSCEFCETLRNNFFHRTPLLAASHAFKVSLSLRFTSSFYFWEANNRIIV